MGDLGIFADDPTRAPSFTLPGPEIGIEDNAIEEAEEEDEDDDAMHKLEM
jgi:hypothetical protein